MFTVRFIHYANTIAGNVSLVGDRVARARARRSCDRLMHSLIRAALQAIILIYSTQTP